MGGADGAAATGADGLRIGDLARLSGLTPRAIRHYHAVGLLAEPRRDAAGYRRYGPSDLVVAVRIVRLRALGMSIDRIRAESLSAPETRDLAASLSALADDVEGELDRLAELRDRLRTLAASASVDRPAQVVTEALRQHGLLDDGTELPAEEIRAIILLDALHPDAIGGVLRQATPLLSDRRAVRRLGELLGRFRTLPDTEADVDALAGELAAVLPRPPAAAASVDPALMDRLLGDRFTSAQLRCLRRMRQLAEGRIDERRASA